MKTKAITVCLHASDPEMSKMQEEIFLQDSGHFERLLIRRRCEIHPEAYKTYSEMLNTAISESSTDVVILVNDKVIPRKGELTRMVSLLDAGFGYVGLYSIGFCALTKSLIKKIGWLDERYIGGGYEDDDFLMRMRMNDIAIYDSHESVYNYMSKPSKQSVSVPLSGSEPHFLRKWKIDDTKIFKVLPEEDYTSKYGTLEDITPKEYMKWDCSVLGYCYGVGPKLGIPSGHPVDAYQGVSRVFRFEAVPYGQRFVGNRKEIIESLGEESDA